MLLNTTILHIILGLIGGVGLFVYGLNKTGKTLQQIASFKFRHLVEKLTKNVFLSTILGIIVTALVQSSSATTVLLVSFINAGLISLLSSIGVIFGANIGTTLTVQLISFNVEQYTLPAIGIGVLLSFVSKRSSLINLGKIMLGFGLIFLGLSVMKEAVAPLSDSSFFKDFLTSIGDYNLKGIILSFFISAIITAVMQASGATLGIVIALASAGILNDVKIAIPIMLGARVGTCVTAFLASIGANRDSKRIALGHFVFNVLSTVLTFIFINYLVKMVTWGTNDVCRQIANAHTLISVLTTLFLFPFTKQYVKFIEYLIPIKKDEDSRQNFFDLKLLKTPSIAISSLKKALLKMGSTTRAMVKISCDGFVNNTIETMRNVSNLESRVDKLQNDISNFIMEISKSELSGYQAFVVNSYREMTNDFERIADHVESMVKSIVQAKNVSCYFTTVNIFLIKKLRDYIMEHFDNTYKAFKNSDLILAKAELEKKETEKEIFNTFINELNQMIKKHNIEPNRGMLIIEIIYNMQRISAHLKRILHNVINIEKPEDEQKTIQKNPEEFSI